MYPYKMRIERRLQCTPPVAMQGDFRMYPYKMRIERGTSIVNTYNSGLFQNVSL